MCVFLKNALFKSLDPTEAGRVWQPDAAAPHAGAGPEDPSLRAAAQGLPEEAARGRSGPERSRE